MILSIALIVVIFSLLIIAHELGHFIVARRNGVKVDEFGIGFPPRIFSIKKKGTEYSINLLPIGGFVRLKGEDGESSDDDSFASKGYRSRAKIVMAGVGVNFAIAYIIIVILLITGIPSILPSGFINVGPIKPSQIQQSNLVVIGVNEGSVAQKNGISKGNEIISLNQIDLKSTGQLQELTKQNAGKEVELAVKNKSQINTYKLKLGDNQQAGYLGVATQPIEKAKYSPLVAIVAAFIVLIQLAYLTLMAFVNFIAGLFTRAQVSEGVAGPVGIVSIFGSVMEFGWSYVLAFVASISLSLAVINSLPIPALDGGRMLVMTLSRLGLKIKPDKEARLHWIGFVFLIIILIIVTVSDISRLK